MSLFIGSIVIQVADVQRATDFWKAALGYAVREEDEDDEFYDEDELDFQVLTDPERRLQLTAMGHARVARYTWETTAEKVAAIFEEAVAR